jgi:hypothetical protein
MRNFSNIYNRITFQDPTLSGASDSPTSEVRIGNMFILLKVWYLESKGWVLSKGIIFIRNLMKIHQL